MRGGGSWRIFYAIMRETVDRMTTALGVLAAVVDGREGDEADVRELRRLAPALAGTPLDELACLVIRQAVDRAEERGAGSRGTRQVPQRPARPLPCAYAPETAAL